MALLDSLKSAGGAAASKAKDAAGVAKLKLDITSAENKMKDLYTEIGKKLIEEQADFAAENFAEQVAALKDFEVQIEALKAEIEKIKG